VLYAALAVMFGIIIWLINRTPEQKNDPLPVSKDTTVTLISDISTEKKDTQQQQTLIEEKKDTQKQQPVEEKKDTHAYVDLGLPSGTLWATTNVGANAPEDPGYYFAWGETTTKSKYDWSTYKYANGAYNKLTKYCNQSGYGNNGYTDSRTVLESTDDAATANWGSDWCMPTQAQFQELKDKCTWTWTTKNGKNGYEVKGPNGNTVFLPAAGYRYGTSLGDVGSNGYYWSASLRTDGPYLGRFLFFNSGAVCPDYWYYRGYGQSVRPVRCR
jgi:hypothetical protein